MNDCVMDSFESKLKYIRAISSRMASLSTDIANRYGMSPEEFDSYIHNRENFSDSDWSRLSFFRSKLQNVFASDNVCLELRSLINTIYGLEFQLRSKRAGVRKNWERV